MYSSSFSHTQSSLAAAAIGRLLNSFLETRNRRKKDGRFWMMCSTAHKTLRYKGGAGGSSVFSARLHHPINRHLILSFLYPSSSRGVVSLSIILTSHLYTRLSPSNYRYRQLSSYSAQSIVFCIDLIYRHYIMEITFQSTDI